MTNKTQNTKVQPYHQTYGNAVYHAIDIAKLRGFELDSSELVNGDVHQVLHSSKPTVGGTTKLRLELTKNGKSVNRMLIINVYGLENNVSPYELTSYIS